MKKEDIREALVRPLQKDLYLDINFFTEVALGFTPSESQRKFLKAVENLQNDRIIVSAPRNTGKSRALSFATAWGLSEVPKQIGREYKVCILGGKFKQAKVPLDYTKEYFQEVPYLKKKVNRMVNDKIELNDGSEVIALKASDKSVHGYHPDCLMADEASDIKGEILDTAFQMVGHSDYERIILDSTPYHFFSKYVDIWQNYDKLGYKKFHFKIEETPWISNEKKERAKREKDKETYQTEFEGLPMTRSSIVFEPEIVRKNILDDRIDNKENVERKTLGVDVGFGVNPSAFIVAQQTNKKWEVIHSEEIFKPSPEEFQNKVEELYGKYNINNIYVDANLPSELMRLQRRNLPAKGIAFQYKREDMIQKLRTLFANERLHISAYHDNLLEELRKITYKKGGGTKKEEGTDLVDALMLAVASPSAERSGFTISTGKYERRRRRNI